MRYQLRDPDRGVLAGQEAVQTDVILEVSETETGVEPVVGEVELGLDPAVHLADVHQGGEPQAHLYGGIFYYCTVKLSIKTLQLHFLSKNIF